MKKIGFLFATIIMMMLFAVSASALEPSGSLGDNVTYTYNSTTGEVVISGNGAMKDYDYNGSTFYYSDIRSVVIEDGVTSIGDYAFFYCSNLTSIIIPEGVTSIGDHAFFNCESLTSITIPEGVTSIGSYAFYNCRNLTSITIPDSVTSIDTWAFSYCRSLTNITIPDSVTSIGNKAFGYCDNLTSITVDANNKYYSSDSDGILFNKNKTELVQYPAGNTSSSYVIPDSVTSIDDDAFRDCTSLTSITIPEGVTSIGSYAFYYCRNLTSITIPDSVTSIGEWTFHFCTSLTNITIPEGVISIGEGAFASCECLISITIPDSVTSIGVYAFYKCISLTSIIVDTDNKYYSSDSNGVLFDKNKTELIQYPAGNTSSSYAIPDSATSIGSEAFFGCSSLTSITIPDSVTSIGNSAFYYCDSLNDVYYVGSQSQWNEMEIESGNECLTDATIYYNYKPHTHSYIAEITTVPTHLAEGVMTYTCDCGDTYTEAVAKIAHTYNKIVTAATCTEDGYTTYICDCGDSLVGNYVNAYGHKDDDGDCKCDYDCGYEYEKPAEPTTPDEPQEEGKSDFFSNIIDLLKSFFDLILSWFKK